MSRNSPIRFAAPSVVQQVQKVTVNTVTETPAVPVYYYSWSATFQRSGSGSGTIPRGGPGRYPIIWARYPY